jgi:hypothetical protein
MQEDTEGRERLLKPKKISEHKRFMDVIRILRCIG